MNQDLIHYQAANQTYEEIIENFVVRQQDLKKVIADLKSTDKDSSFQHYIFVGRRGSGKSTLLRRIEAEICTNAKLTSDYEIVNLGEEQSGIYKLHDLWDNVIRDLNTKNYNIEEIDFRTYRDDLKAYSKKLHAQIISAIRTRQKKRLILLVDNIDRIFKNIGDDSDLFRELLMNYLDIRIIGGSTFMSEQFWKYDNPFYQFFTIRHLEALSIDEIKALFARWSKVKGLPEIEEAIRANPGKLQSIRMLTDGTPRSMLIFVDMLLKRPNLRGYDYLNVIVDKATPIYQERLGTLSPAQNKVITELSYFWEASRVKDLIPKCKMEGKTISALLNQLSKLQYVEKIKGETKDLYYRIEERFFNLWLIMTQGGPLQKLEAKYLTEFLETWYNQKELNQLCQEFSLDMKGEKSKASRLMPMSHALLNAKSVSKENKIALYSKLRNELKVSDVELGKVESYFEDLTPEIVRAFDDSNYKRVIELLQISNLPAGRKFFGLGLAYYKIGEYAQSEENYLLAIDDGDIDSLNNLAIIYDEQEKYKKAEKYYLLSIENGDLGSLHNLAIVYDEQEKYEKAEKYYLLAIDNGVIESLYNLAFLYHLQKKYERAEKYYLLAIEQGEIKSLNNLAILYGEQGKYKQAKKYYQRAIEEGDLDAYNGLINMYYFCQNKSKLKKLLLDENSGVKQAIGGELLSMCYLYLGEMERFYSAFETITHKKNINSMSGDYLINLLIHNQINLVEKLFFEYEVLQEKFKPLHYSVLLMKDSAKEASLRIPPELQESIDDIVSTITNFRKRFYGKKNKIDYQSS